MKKQILYLSIVLVPFLMIIMTNEFVRLHIDNTGSKYQGATTINSSQKLKGKCSWACHNNTTYCKVTHVKFTQPYFDKIDPIYFGIINSLKSTGDYGLANIIFLVILFPLIIFFLLTKSLRMEAEIRRIKKEQISNG